MGADGEHGGERDDARPSLEELVGENVPAEELARLRRVDALLRAVRRPPWPRVTRRQSDER